MILESLLGLILLGVIYACKKIYKIEKTVNSLDGIIEAKLDLGLQDIKHCVRHAEIPKVSAQIQDLSNRICDLTNLKILVEKNLSHLVDLEVKKPSGQKGKPKSEEHKRKIAEAMKKRNESKGKELLDEQLRGVENENEWISQFVRKDLGGDAIIQ